MADVVQAIQKRRERKRWSSTDAPNLEVVTDGTESLLVPGDAVRRSSTTVVSPHHGPSPLPYPLTGTVCPASPTPPSSPQHKTDQRVQAPGAPELDLPIICAPPQSPDASALSPGIQFAPHSPRLGSAPVSPLFRAGHISPLLGSAPASPQPCSAPMSPQPDSYRTSPRVSLPMLQSLERAGSGSGSPRGSLSVLHNTDWAGSGSMDSSHLSVPDKARRPSCDNLPVRFLSSMDSFHSLQGSSLDENDNMVVNDKETVTSPQSLSSDWLDGSSSTSQSTHDWPAISRATTKASHDRSLDLCNTSSLYVNMNDSHTTPPVSPTLSRASSGDLARTSPSLERATFQNNAAIKTDASAKGETVLSMLVKRKSEKQFAFGSLKVARGDQNDDTVAEETPLVTSNPSVSEGISSPPYQSSCMPSESVVPLSFSHQPITSSCQVSVTLPPSQSAGVTSPPCQASVTSSQYQADVTSPPCQPSLTSSPYQADVTLPPCQAGDVTSPPCHVSVTSSPYQADVTSPPCQPAVTLPPCQPACETPPCQASVTSSFHQDDVTSPLCQPAATSPSCQPGMTSPPCQPSLTPLSMFTSSSREMTSAMSSPCGSANVTSSSPSLCKPVLVSQGSQTELMGSDVEELINGSERGDSPRSDVTPTRKSLMSKLLKQPSVDIETDDEEVLHESCRHRPRITLVRYTRDRPHFLHDDSDDSETYHADSPKPYVPPRQDVSTAGGLLSEKTYLKDTEQVQQSFELEEVGCSTRNKMLCVNYLMCEVFEMFDMK